MAERVVFDARYVNDRYHGIGRYAFRLLEALVDAAPARPFVILRGRAPDGRFDWDALSRRANVTLAAGPWPLYWPHEQLLLAWQLRRLEAGIYHSPYFVAPLLARTPSLITVHDLIFDRYPAYMPQRWAFPYYRFLMKAGTRRARRIIAVSAATARDLAHFYGPAAAKVRVIGEAADPALQPVTDPAHLSRLRRGYGLEKPFVLSVGARRPHKNLGRLVRAYAQVAADVPHDLILLGPEDDRFPDEARGAAAAHGLFGRVRFLGWVPEADLPGLYTLADLVAVPSLIEGFGLPALEAMACGTAVLANDATSLPEVVGNGGHLVDATDAHALATGLRQLLTDEERRARLAAAGRGQAKRFSWQEAARQVLDVYDEIEGGRERQVDGTA
jgi:alpha-1,3-rhamnosyl/mannosyltransferase